MSGTLYSVSFSEFYASWVNAILGSLKGNYAAEVGAAVTSAVLAKPSDKDGPAVYRPKNEQLEKLDELYDRFKRLNVWSMDAAEVCLV